MCDIGWESDETGERDEGGGSGGEANTGKEEEWGEDADFHFFSR